MVPLGPVASDTVIGLNRETRADRNADGLRWWAPRAVFDGRVVALVTVMQQAANAAALCSAQNGGPRGLPGALGPPHLPPYLWPLPLRL